MRLAADVRTGVGRKDMRRSPSEDPLAGGKGWDRNISPALPGECLFPGSMKPTMVPLRFPNLGVSQGLRCGGVPGNSGGPGVSVQYLS